MLSSPRFPFAFLLGLAFLTSGFLRAQEPAFEIKEGDRVVFLGDALLERENTYGYLETRLHEQFPSRSFMVRNLSWSGDTPAGWSRASFDGPDKGIDRMKEHLALVKPTVVFLGYGMAASLQEMTDRAQDPTLNPDPARYGSEPMSAARFKKELGALMDLIEEDRKADSENRKEPVRFVLLSPIKHEDLRTVRPGLPDPAEHNRLLGAYSNGIKELATERGARFCDLFNLGAPFKATEDGVHLSWNGLYFLSFKLSKDLGWNAPQIVGPEKRDPIRNAILRKNDIFFHRFRPANSTYLFGFRKHEQGQNAKEMAEFEPILAQADAEIDRIKREVGKEGAKLNEAPQGPSTPPAKAGSAQDGQKAEPLPLPHFDVDPSLEITLWAETPMLGKPTQMSWDPEGRLWVSCTPIYPQILPGAHPDDKVVILEDTDRDGKADKSFVFADDLLIPSSVAADVGPKPGEKGAKARSRNAAYIGASTELLYLSDNDGDGKADDRRVVLSGFGTEDTHHTIHTLRWGPDGRLYFDQSVYIHSHLETPWGMVRLNAGGVFAYDPRTERVEVFSKGLWNPWGHAWDQWGQSFLTDGAGFNGISWAFPGAVFNPSEGARKTLPSISPGTYPKFAGLEIIRSPLFPADWQGTAVTCDFRAHRVVRFAIDDLSEAKPAETVESAENKPVAVKSGYITREMPDVARTAELAFRPIDVRLGPDGALYIADWTNPVINHGEVDFRDPRRDHVHGRIWRIAPKGSKPLKWEKVAGKLAPELLERSISVNQWEREQSSKAFWDGAPNSLSKRSDQLAFGEMLLPWISKDASDEKRNFVAQGSNRPGADKWTEGELTGFLFATDSISSSRIGSSLSRSLGLFGNAPIGTLTIDEREAKQGEGFQAAVEDAFAKRKDPAITREQIEAELKARAREEFWPLMRSGFAKMAVETLGPGISSRNPRLRISAMRALAQIPAAEASAAVLDAALKAPADDPFYEFAAWASINDLATVWTDALAKGRWKADTEEKQKQLTWGLGAIRPEIASAALSRLMTAGQVPLDGSGPWIELIGKAGDSAALGRVFDSLVRGEIAGDVSVRALTAIGEAGRTRGIRPASELKEIASFFHKPQAELASAAIRAAGPWGIKEFIPLYAQQARSEQAGVRDAAVAALRETGAASGEAKADAISALTELCEDSQPTILRRRAAVALAALDLQKSLAVVADVLNEQTTEPDALDTWRGLLAGKDAPNILATSLPRNLPPVVSKTGLRAAREIGKKGEKLVAFLAPLTGETLAPATAPSDWTALAEIVKRDGDPARGEEVYRRVTLACVTCHAIGGAGGKVGPELGTIGASAPLDYIIESVLAPGAKVKEGYHAINLTLKDGTVAAGVLARETDKDLIVRTATGQEQAVPKANIASRENIGSLMPANLVATLKDRERIDLYAFLGQLGKAGVYDSSKANVARTWWLYSKGSTDTAGVGSLKGGDGIPAYANVDGRLPKEKLTELSAMVQGDAFFAVSKFNAATAGKTVLNLQGVREAWLDGKPLPVASEPSPQVDLTAGDHVLAVKLDTAQLPESLRAASDPVRFLNE